MITFIQVSWTVGDQDNLVFGPFPDGTKIRGLHVNLRALKDRDGGAPGVGDCYVGMNVFLLPRRPDSLNSSVYLTPGEACGGFGRSGSDSDVARFPYCPLGQQVFIPLCVELHLNQYVSIAFDSNAVGGSVAGNVGIELGNYWSS